MNVFCCSCGTEQEWKPWLSLASQFRTILEHVKLFLFKIPLNFKHVLKCFPESGLKWMRGCFSFILGWELWCISNQSRAWNRGVSEGSKERKNERKNKQTHKENDPPAKTTGMNQKTTVCSIKADGELNKDYKQNLCYSLAITGDYREQQSSDQPLWTPGSGFVQT